MKITSSPPPAAASSAVVTTRTGTCTYTRCMTPISRTLAKPRPVRPTLADHHQLVDGLPTVPTVADLAEELEKHRQDRKSLARSPARPRIRREPAPGRTAPRRLQKRPPTAAPERRESGHGATVTRPRRLRPRLRTTLKLRTAGSSYRLKSSCW